MEDLKSQYKLKEDAYGAPKQYLGANVETYQLDDSKDTGVYMQETTSNSCVICHKNGVMWMIASRLRTAKLL